MWALARRSGAITTAQADEPVIVQPEPIMLAAGGLKIFARGAGGFRPSPRSGQARGEPDSAGHNRDPEDHHDLQDWQQAYVERRSTQTARRPQTKEQVHARTPFFHGWKGIACAEYRNPGRKSPR